jgi:hypothetical protein
MAVVEVPPEESAASISVAEEPVLSAAEVRGRAKLGAAVIASRGVAVRA